MISLKMSDTEIYLRGAKSILDERASELLPDQIDTVIQESRRQLKSIQETIAKWERVRMDSEIRIEAETRKKKVVETRYDERGRPYQAVISS